MHKITDANWHAKHYSPERWTEFYLIRPKSFVYHLFFCSFPIIFFLDRNVKSKDAYVETAGIVTRGVDVAISDAFNNLSLSRRR